MNKRKFVDFKKLVTRVWLILWAILGILLIMKYCFNIWYPIISNSDLLNNAFLYIDNHWILLRIIAYTLYVISSNILFLTCISKKKFDKIYQFVLFSILSLQIVMLKDKFNIVGLICEILIVVFAIVYNLKIRSYQKKIINILQPIIIYLLLNFWQLNIYLIRDFDIAILQTLPSLYSIILMLDYYIFLIITWIGVSYMGIFSWGWLFGKELTELKAMKAEELAKENPDKELVEKIDEAIEKKEVK